MSAYSDWKCGALTDEEYESAMRWEHRFDKDDFYDIDDNEEGDEYNDEL